MFLKSFDSLKSYCERQNYSGWDPYDGLNSKVFQLTPFKYWDLARLVWIQGFKRSPINFRKLLLVPKDHNSKGIGLFLHGYCNIYKAQQVADGVDYFDQEDVLSKIKYLADLLISMQSGGYSGACWGYNFDWQARRLFFFPKNTPTVVVTTFCAVALFKAYEVTKDESVLQTALSSAKFVLNDLQRTHKNGGYLFSYSPLKGNKTVYNASLLGSKLLSYCYYYRKDERLKTAARRSVQACIDAQKKNGSWFYGELPIQHWIDSFHTGYNLDALKVYHDYTGDESVEINIEKGFEFYINNFFLENGIPKYYHNNIYPIDIHCPGQLFVTLARLNKTSEYNEVAEKVMNWTIKNMQDKKGYFYYQIRKCINSKIPYMRWSNAFMFYAQSFYFMDLVNNYG